MLSKRIWLEFSEAHKLCRNLWNVSSTWVRYSLRIFVVIFDVLYSSSIRATFGIWITKSGRRFWIVTSCFMYNRQSSRNVGNVCLRYRPSSRTNVWSKSLTSETLLSVFRRYECLHRPRVRNLLFISENAPARRVFKATRTAMVIIRDFKLQEKTLTLNHAEIRTPTAEVRGHKCS
jgi:hypothetical protein